MEKEKLHTPEYEHQESKPKRIVQAGASVKPTTFAVGGKVFEMAGFIGATARTIKERLKKADVIVGTKTAERIYESINGKTKGE